MEKSYTDEPISFPDSWGSNNGGAAHAQRGMGGVGRWDFVEPDDPAELLASARDDFGDMDDLPLELRDLMAMTRDGYRELNRAKSFYKQAQMMAGFEDSAQEVAFSAYYPTYASMTLPQMRSYFTLRALLRRGHFPEMSLSYLYVYIYELLMLVGVKIPQEALELLEELLEAYGPDNKRLSDLLTQWIMDFKVYYQLSGQAGSPVPAAASSSAADTLDQLMAIKGNPLLRSQSCKRYPEETRAASLKVVGEIDKIFNSRYGLTIGQALRGKMVERSHGMFASAVVFRPNPVREADWWLTPTCHYRCEGGMWTVSRPEGSPQREHLVWLKAALREIDCQLRLVLGIKQKLVSQLADPELRTAIHRAIMQWQHEKAEAERPKIEVDFSKLASIREDAEVVREALIVDPEHVEEAAAEIPTPPAVSELLDSPAAPTVSTALAAEATPTAETASTSPVSPAVSTAEAALISALLSGQSWREAIQPFHTPLGVIIERINEQMLDELGDTPIIEGDAGPEIIDDYRDDLIAAYGL